MNRIDVTRPFFLYANCIVRYDGRAKSTTSPGLRVIIHKLDGSFIVHHSRLITPLNYMGPKSELSGDDNILISTNKQGETITVELINIIAYEELIEWNSDSARMSGTESQMCDYIENNPSEFFDFIICNINRELRTPNGAIDIVITDDRGIRHCIEVKRKRANLRSVFQLRNYIEYMNDHFTCIGYIAAPDIGTNALDEAINRGYKFLRIDPHLIGIDNADKRNYNCARQSYS